MSKASRLYGRPWVETEYILALDAYLAFEDQPRHQNSPFVKELAELLGRTPASIYMRMENFASIDPSLSEKRKGLGNINPLCWRVFNDWHGRPEDLKVAAEVLRKSMARSPQLELFESESVAIPKAFGKYELLDLLGSGSFGSVYSCIDIQTEKPGAIKIIQASKVYDSESLHRFVREIRALKAVKHPNVVRLHEDNLETEKNFPAFVMDLAESSLADYIKQKSGSSQRLPVLKRREAIEIVRAMIAAIRALHTHRKRIIHRDLNPNNILLLSNGTWVLGDFGLAKFLGPVSSSTAFTTRTQVGWGTAFYPAPEQYRDFKRTDQRTDIHALGILLWELFTTIGPPPDRQNSGLELELHNVYLNATHRDPKDRFSTVDDFDEAFEAALAGDDFD